MIALIITCQPLWPYFGCVEDLLEDELVNRVCGIIAPTIGFDASHATEFATGRGAVAIGTGLALFPGSTAVALQRAHGCILWNRLILGLLTVVGFTWSATVSAQAVLIVAAAGPMVVVVYEQFVTRPKVVRLMEASQEGSPARRNCVYPRSATSAATRLFACSTRGCSSGSASCHSSANRL